jgi:hypothetical protein
VRGRPACSGGRDGGGRCSLAALACDLGSTGEPAGDGGGRWDDSDGELGGPEAADEWIRGLLRDSAAAEGGQPGGPAPPSPAEEAL